MEIASADALTLLSCVHVTGNVYTAFKEPPASQWISLAHSSVFSSHSPSPLRLSPHFTNSLHHLCCRHLRLLLAPCCQRLPPPPSFTVLPPVAACVFPSSCLCDSTAF
ncbi:hypothetical protein PIB30_009486 [Stylosanthes scabra]|uniref:Uncharacterized protein n=1 Tax=Stylosanthes scabra TaxID=79078 RepID=A0ABU6Y5D1_9FABA|nr:hypothetical protein [Stylosanthes scabra]